ncbi:hypothetical protein [Pseudoalteromonas marina]|uniref:hypothetical protein n=1 Tax=Pseudoalteromonas marina TaxID=267375 RepID=UPI0023F0855C|nr:hypothetical protein [Pseudoalteromonas marina]
MKYPNTEKLSQAERALINDLCPNEKAKFDEWFDELKSKYMHLLGYIDIRYWYDVFMSGADTDEAATKVKTPCIMRFKDDYLFYFDSMKHLNLTSMEIRVSSIESCDSNVTNQFLSNTWGIVESKEHAEFIVELAELHGFELIRLGVDELSFFRFGFSGFSLLNNIPNHIANCKQITIPLPPKIEPLKNAGDNLILGCEQDFKVARRIINELREEANCSDELLAKRDEWPCVGGDVEYAGVKCKVLLSADKDGHIVVDKNGNYANPHIDDVKKPKTPEEALRDDLINRISSYLAVIPGLLDNPDEAMYASHQAACELLTKYNITPKD